MRIKHAYDSYGKLMENYENKILIFWLFFTFLSMFYLFILVLNSVILVTFSLFLLYRIIYT